MHRYSVVCLAVLLLVSTSFLLHAGQVAIVYSPSHSGDYAQAASIKAFLDSRGYPATLVPMSAVASQDFATFQLIIVTDSSGSMSSWGDSVTVAAIKNANRAVLGIGEGGYAFFGKLGLPIGYPYGMHTTANSILVPLYPTDLFLAPNLVPVPPDRSILVYDSLNALVEYYDSGHPSSMRLLAGVRVAEPVTYSVFTDKAHYGLWGFSYGPERMTSVGKDLFENFVALLSRNEIAYYPLTTSALDSTGNMPPMSLTNAPFEKGGIYCNGNYINGPDTPRCQASTPNFNGLNSSSFSVEAKFMVSGPPDTSDRPVIVGGSYYRWISGWLETNGEVAFKGNNGAVHSGSPLMYSYNEWHTLTATYDSASALGSLYFDDVLAATMSYNLIHGNASDFSITDYGRGRAFKGWLRDLTVYNAVIVPQASVPVPIAPTYRGTNISTSTTLIWRAVPHATSYTLRLGTDSTFASDLLLDVSTISDTALAATGLPGNTHLFWQVRATTSAGTGEWSARWEFTTGNVTGIAQARSLPDHFALEQNWPNPFNPFTTIKYTVGGAGIQGPGAGEAGARGSGLGTRKTRLVVYDVLGRQVATLVDEDKAPGNYEVRFDGSGLASGIYIYRLAAGGYTETRKMALVK